ncbi:MAG: hypothetical protein MMC23_009221 [Stictis urceolatum]|nr:hypothetical protein [Stictis urceolata]
MHSASIAVRALIELYRKVSREQELDQKILVFSVAHDPSFVKIYGHYAKINGPSLRYFRYLIRSFDFIDTDVEDSANTSNRKDRWTAYRFTRKVYEDFVPRHLDRIRRALSPLVEQSPESEYEVYTSNLEAPSEHVAQNESSSHVVGLFKKPGSSATSMFQEENRRLERVQQHLQQEKDELRNQVNTLIQQQQEQQARQQEENRRLERDQQHLQQEKDELRNQVNTLIQQQQEQQVRQQEQQARQEEQLNKLRDLLVQQKERAEQQREKEREEIEKKRREEREEMEKKRREEREEMEKKRKEEREEMKQLMLMLKNKT